MRHARWMGLVLVAQLSLSGACGDDDSGGGGSAVKGPKASADGKIGNQPASTKLSDLSGADLKAACEDVAASFDEEALRRAACITFGLFAKQLGQDCQKTYDDCMKKPADGECDDEKVMCGDVTLADVEQCQIDQANALVTATKGLSCADDISKLASSEQTSTPECMKIDKNCPELFDNDDGNVTISGN